jgi:hypothetical protein
MKKQVDQYIPAALEAAALLYPANDAKSVYEEYDGYAASLGAAIVTADFQAAIAFYSDSSKEKEKDKGKKPYRYHILKAIAKILADNGVEKTEPAEADGLLRYIIGLTEAEQKIARRQVIQASIALKLALRSFNHVKSPKK